MKIKVSGQFIVTASLLLVIVFLLCGNFVMQSRAQGIPVIQGFWFWKKPAPPQAMIDTDRAYLEAEIERLQILAAIPAGNTAMTDCGGNLVTWDQAMIDALNAEIGRKQQLLIDIPQ